MVIADYILLSSGDKYLCTVEAKKHSKSPLTGKEQAIDLCKLSWSVGLLFCLMVLFITYGI